MDAKLEQMLINELQPAVKFKQLISTPMKHDEKEECQNRIGNQREYWRHMYPTSLLKREGERPNGC